MVRRLDDDGGLDPVGVALVNDALDGGGDEHVAVEFEQVGVGYVIRAGESDDAGSFLQVLDDLWDVEAAWVVDAALDAADGDDPATHLVGDPRDPATDLSESLNHDASAIHGKTHVFSRLAHDVDGATARGCVASN